MRRCANCGLLNPPLNLWSKIDKREDGCWIWTGNLNNKGYGQVSEWASKNKAKHISLHRLMWEWENKRRIPEGLIILHTCDRPACVNPAHLRLATRKENQQDMVKKGRMRGPIHPCRGEAQGAAVLDEVKVREIFAHSRKGLGQRKIAVLYGVTKTAISAVLHRKTWSWVTLDEKGESDVG